MHKTLSLEAATAGLEVGTVASAAPRGMAKLLVLHREELESGSLAPAAELRVLHARLEPGDRTPHHSHRFPVTLYMLEGEFTLDLTDRPAPVVVRAGETFVEPANVAMTGYNHSLDGPATMVIFYACETGTPFADPLPEPG